MYEDGIVRTEAIYFFLIMISMYNADELIKLARDDYGRYVSKAEMARDKVLLPKHCLTAFVKQDIRSLDDSFFSTVRDKDCTPDAYVTNYNKPLDDNMKKEAMKYTLDKDILLITPLPQIPQVIP